MKFEGTGALKRNYPKSEQVFGGERELSQNKGSLISEAFKNIKDFDSMKENLGVALIGIEEKIIKDQGGLENARLKSLEDKISRGFSFS